MRVFDDRRPQEPVDEPVGQPDDSEQDEQDEQDEE